MREVLFLHRDTKGAATWLEAAGERIGAFSRWAGGDPAAVVNAVWKLYAERSPALGLWIMLESPTVRALSSAPTTIIGHVLVDVRAWDGHLVAWVSQVQMDLNHDALSAAEIARMLAEIDGWIARWNEGATPDRKVAEMLFSTPREHEAWARRFGFFKHRELRRRAVPVS